MPILALAFTILTCPFVAPVRGPVVAGFAPVGSYGGHWGIDFGAVPGTPVRAQQFSNSCYGQALR